MSKLFEFLRILRWMSQTEDPFETAWYSVHNVASFGPIATIHANKGGSRVACNCLAGRCELRCTLHNNVPQTSGLTKCTAYLRYDTRRSSSDSQQTKQSPQIKLTTSWILLAADRGLHNNYCSNDFILLSFLNYKLIHKKNSLTFHIHK